MYDDPQPQRVGHMFSAISIEAFMPMAEFLSRMDEKERETRQGPPAPGFERVSMPGDGTHERMAMHREDGIPLTAEDSAAAARHWRLRAEAWATALGFAPRQSSREVAAAAVSALASVQQSAQLAQLELSALAPLLREAYRIRVRGGSEPVPAALPGGDDAP
jgi:hypothetical protein